MIVPSITVIIVCWYWIIVNMTLLWQSEVIRSHCIWLPFPQSNKVVSVLEGWKPLNLNYNYWIFKENDCCEKLICKSKSHPVFQDKLTMYTSWKHSVNRSLWNSWWMTNDFMLVDFLTKLYTDVAATCHCCLISCRECYTTV